MTDLQQTNQKDFVVQQTLNRKKSLTLKSLTSVQKHKTGTIILADISGSMSGEKLYGLKKALSQIWSTGLSGIAFNHNLYELTELDIQFLHATGTTDMLGALQEARKLEKAHVILITDGYPNSTQDQVLEEVRLYTNTVIDTVGIADGSGCGYDQEFLRKIAELTRGKFTDVNEPLKLTETLKKLLTWSPTKLQNSIQL